MKKITEAVQLKWKMAFEDKFKVFFSTDDEQMDAVLDAMRTNLREGRLKFVILMDAIDERLKDLITYVNQNSQFDIYAVQLEYYKHDEYEIVIPKLFGAEVTKSPGVSSTKRKWNEEKVLEDARQNLTADEYKLFEKIYRFARERANLINFGRGSYGSFSPIFPAVE